MGFMKFLEFNLSTNNDILNALAKCIFNIIKKVDFPTKAKPNFFSPLFSISLRLQRKPPRGLPSLLLQRRDVRYWRTYYIRLIVQ